MNVVSRGLSRKGIRSNREGKSRGEISKESGNNLGTSLTRLGRERPFHHTGRGDSCKGSRAAHRASQKKQVQEVKAGKVWGKDRPAPIHRLKSGQCKKKLYEL